MDRTIAALILAFVCLAVPLSGQTFSVALLEDSAGAEATELSNAVLSGCLDQLFYAGFIATNETIGRIARPEFQSSALGLQSAREGYVDFLALVWIRYAVRPSDPPVRYPEALAWRLVRVRDGSALAEGFQRLEQYESGTTDERTERLSRLGRGLADLWAKTLKKERG
ncbi:MAG: hypothetical protein GX430_09215 [Treponema sp.]|nr:hypothetical protein [Treponema sp.]